MLAYAEIPLAGPVEDASTCCVLLNERERWYGLDGMLKKYIGEEKLDDELHQYLADQFGGKPNRQGPNIWRAPGDIVAPYACQDAGGTLRLYDAVRPRVAAEGLDEIYAVETGLLPLLLKMHQVGVRVDLGYAERLKDELNAAAGRAAERWNDLAPGVPIYGPRVAEFFRGELGLSLPPTEKTAALPPDQQRPSLTKEILEGLAEEQPVAAELLLLRMLTKYSGTFLDSYVFANADADAAIHGEFHPLPVEYEPGKKYGAVSGRFSSGGALNLQNLPGDRFPWAGLLLRRVFVPYHKEQVWWKWDYCLAAGTEIETLMGPKKIEDVVTGDKLFAWDDGWITWDEVKKTAAIGALPAYRVTLDDGSSFVASGDHGLVLRDGTRRDIRDLQPGNRLAALRFGTAGPGGYRTAYSWSNRRYEYVHDIVAEAYLGPKPPGHEVHHLDQDNLNNMPENLRYVTRRWHRGHHGFQNVNEDRRVHRLRAALRYRRSYDGMLNPNWRGGQVEKVCKQCGGPFADWASQHRRRCVPCRRRNHVVIRVEALGQNVPMYHLEMTKPGHNFALSCGIISLNSQIEYRFLAHYAGGVIADAYKQPPAPGVCRACGADHAVTGVDFHCLLTLLIDQLDVCPRRRTKNVNFAYVYGAGVKKAAATAGISVALMRDILALYDEKTDGVIKQLARRAADRAKQRGYIVTWGGRRQRFMSAAEARALGWHLRPGEAFVETHKALNKLLQGSAADLIKKAMLRVGEVVDWQNTHLHLTVHDELALSGPPRASADGARFEARMREAMEDFPLASGVPIRADVSVGSSWGTTKLPTVSKAPTAAEAILTDVARRLGLAG